MHPDPGLVFSTPPDVLRQRMMVAEFVARQQNGSPVNGETPSHNHTNSNMPGREHNSRMHMTPSPSSPYLHERHGGDMLMGGGGSSGNESPRSPSQDSYSQSGYDLSSHLKRKELFTQRKQREFIPDNKKDDSYWDRRRRNNEAAKRSREKRRFNDMVLEQRVVELTKENHVLKAQLDAIKDKYDICGENLISVDQILATLPTNEQVLSITKRAKLSNTVPPTIIYPQSPSPVPTSVIHQPIQLESPTPSPPPPSVKPQMQSQSSPLPMPLSLPLSINGGGGGNGGNNNINHHTSHHPHTHNHNHTHSQTHPSHVHAHPHAHPHSHPHSLNHTHSHTHPHVYQTRQSSPHPNDTDGNVCYRGQEQEPAYSHHHHHHYAPYPTNAVHDIQQYNSSPNVLNLSRRAPTPYEVSSGTGSGTASGDDEQCENQPIADTNNSLPLKLRHKSHLGDKDAATALLALQHIKQEPGARSSPPWDGEGSSDERDSGISIGTTEWTTLQRKIILPTAAIVNNVGGGVNGNVVVGVVGMNNNNGNNNNGNNNNGNTTTINNGDKEEENIHLKSQLARLESEVATIKNMMILNTSNVGVGATAAAQ